MAIALRAYFYLDNHAFYAFIIVNARVHAWAKVPRALLKGILDGNDASTARGASIAIRFA